MRKGVAKVWQKSCGQAPNNETCAVTFSFEEFPEETSWWARKQAEQWISQEKESQARNRLRKIRLPRSDFEQVKEGGKIIVYYTSSRSIINPVYADLP